MSRAYNMQLTVTDFNIKKADDILHAAREHWGFGDDLELNEDSERIVGSADGSLCGGETEDQFAARLCKAIFKANKGPCKVSIQATYLEDLPCETYEFSKDNLPK